MASSLKTAPSTPVPVQYQSAGQTRPWTEPIPTTWNTTGSATCVLTANSVGYFLIVANGFGFAIPAGATINGIIVEYKVNTAGTDTVYDSEVVMVKGGVLGSINRASATSWKINDWLSHGGATDLWGTTWTPAQINAADFGSAVSPKLIGATSYDAVLTGCRITVYYTETSVKTVNGLAKASVKTKNYLALASIKTFNGLQ